VPAVAVRHETVNYASSTSVFSRISRRQFGHFAGASRMYSVTLGSAPPKCTVSASFHGWINGNVRKVRTVGGVLTTCRCKTKARWYSPRRA
jgi:hypothetical protein